MIFFKYIAEARGGTCIIIEGHFDDGWIFLYCFVLIQTGIKNLAIKMEGGIN